MKNIFFLMLLCLSISQVSAQQEMEIRTDGIVIPRITNAERPFSPAVGHLVFNTDQDRFEYYDGSSWVSFSSGSASNKISDFNSSVTIVGTGDDKLEIELDGKQALKITNNPNLIANISFPSSNSTAIGKGAGAFLNKLAIGNIALGDSTLHNNVTADQNIAIGSKALKDLNHSDNAIKFGDGNIAIGQASMENATSNSSYNIALGQGAGKDANGVNSVFIGRGAGTGASKLDNSLYISNSEGDNPLIYGDFANKSVGINYNGSQLEDALHVENNSAIQGPMRIRVDGTTKFRVHNNGGLSIGTFAAPFDNGLKVANLDEDGPPTPLYADDRGNVTRRSGLNWVFVDPAEFRDPDGRATFEFTRVRLAPWTTSPFWGGPLALASIKVPDNARIKVVKFFYIDEGENVLHMFANEYDILSDSDDTFGSTSSAGSSSEVRTRTIFVDKLVNNNARSFQIGIVNFHNLGGSGTDALFYGASVGYEY